MKNMLLRSFKIPCVATLFVGSILLVVSLSFLVIFPNIYRKRLDDQLVLTNGTILFNLWKDLPLPVYQKLYFFNITNSVQFVNYGSKMRLQELGPYTYRSEWNKEGIVWHPNGTVSYREVKTFHFEPERSVGSEDELIVTLNGPLVAAASALKKSGTAAKSAAEVFFALNKERLIIRKTVSELAFEGYDDAIIRVGHFLHPEMPFKEGKFGWLYGRNHTDDGLFTVYTGEDDIQKLNLITEWNGRPGLIYWKAKPCNAINGSNGEVSPPLKLNQTTLQFFQPFFCRSVAFEYTGGQTHLEIDTLRFEATSRIFADAQTNPDNSCFDTGSHLPSGVLDLSVCQYGVPVVLSFPHFYLADRQYVNAVIGLEPNATFHGSHIDVEPATGVSLDLAVRFQINLQLSSVKDLAQFSNLTSGVYPILWVEMEASMTENLALFLQQRLKEPKKIAIALLCVAIAIFAAMTLGSILTLFFIRKRPSSESQPLLMDDGHKVNYSSVDGVVNRGQSVDKSAEFNRFSTERRKSTEKSPKYVQVASLSNEGKVTGGALESSKTESLKANASKSNLDPKIPK